MRKNYIHAQNKVYGNMDGLQAFCLFRKGMFSEELYLRQKAVLENMENYSVEFVDRV